MKLAVPFLDIKGEPVIQDGESVMLTQVITSCLVNSTGTGEQKLNYFSLSLKIQGAEDVELTLAERTMIKEIVGKTGTVLMVGRVQELFDDAKSKPKSKN